MAFLPEWYLTRLVRACWTIDMLPPERPPRSKGTNLGLVALLAKMLEQVDVVEVPGNKRVKY